LHISLELGLNMIDDSNNKILLVDDEAAILTVLSQRLSSLGYDCDTESDGLRALHRMRGNQYQLVILDIKMPYISGTEVLKGAKSHDANMSVVMMSGLDSIEIVRQTLREGAYDYLVKPLDYDDLEITVRRAIEHGNLLRKNRDYRKSLELEVEERTKELSDALLEIKKTYDATILALGSALETRDIETQAHGLRVARYSLLLARTMGSENVNQLTDIERGAYLHDIGKIGVPDHILRKTSSLSDEEWIVMKRHPEIGKRMIEGIDFLRGSIPIVFYHHERFDGTGYTQGLKGDGIPIEARIFAVADALDAMISDRPYRKAMPLPQAKEIINNSAGKHFDPSVVEVFCGISDDDLIGIDSLSPNEKHSDRITSDLLALGETLHAG